MVRHWMWLMFKRERICGYEHEEMDVLVLPASIPRWR